MASNKISKFFFRKALVWSANLVAKKARRNASWSGRIPKAIKVGKVRESDNSMSITISVDPKLAPHAGAFEKGSGIHGEKRRKYKIEPKPGKDFLAFLWPGAPPEAASRQSKTTGKYIFPSVDHPGVKAKPFLEPALDNSMSVILNRFSGATVDMIKGSLGAKVEIIK